MNTERNGGWIVALTFFAAICLSIVPMPYWAQWGRPEWVAMVVLYWTMALPHRVGVGTAWLVGLLLDIVESTPPGQNAFALAVVAYLSLVLYQRSRMYAVWQQAGIVFVLVGINQLLGHWVQTLLGTAKPNILFILPAIFSALLWPWVLILLRFLRRRYHIT